MFGRDAIPPGSLRPGAQRFFNALLGDVRVEVLSDVAGVYQALVFGVCLLYTSRCV